MRTVQIHAQGSRRLEVHSEREAQAAIIRASRRGALLVQYRHLVMGHTEVMDQALAGLIAHGREIGEPVLRPFSRAAVELIASVESNVRLIKLTPVRLDHITHYTLIISELIRR